MEHQLLRSFIFLAALSVPVFILARVGIHYKRKQQNREPSVKREIYLFVFFIYLVFVASFTLVPVPIVIYREGEEFGLNLTPLVNTLNTIKGAKSTYHSYLHRNAYENLVGNILLFIPLGILLPLLFKKYNSFLKVFLFGFLMSLLIEIIQYVSNYFHVHRMADIDDVIFNVTGAITGYIIYLIIARLQHRELTAN